MKILVYRLGSLGDTCIVIPLFNALKRRYPTASVTLLTNIPVNGKAIPSADLLIDGGLINDVIAYPVSLRKISRLLTLWKVLKAQKFDYILNITSARGVIAGIRDFLFLSSLGASILEGTPLRYRDQFVTFNEKFGIYDKEFTRIKKRVNSLSDIVGDGSSDWLWSLHLTSREIKIAEKWKNELGTKKYIAFSIGTKVEIKDWGDKAWSECLSLISAEYPEMGLIVLGSSDEYSRSCLLARHWFGCSLVLAGKITVRESAAVLMGAEFFLGQDSGPMHLATCVGTRCIAVFSARNPVGQWFPNRVGHTIFYHKVECASCNLEHSCPFDLKCLKLIKPKFVAEKVISLISEHQISQPMCNYWIDPCSNYRREIMFF